LAGSSSLTRSFSTASLVDSAGQYSTSEVAELVGLKATQVRHYVRRNLLTPQRGRRGEFRFSFQDVVMLRSAKELLDADVPVRRANRVLLDLKARNAQVSRPLSSMRVQAEGTRVVVQEGNKAWDAESGQGSLPFMFDAPESDDNAAGANKIAAFSILQSGSDPVFDSVLGTEDDPFADLRSGDSAENPADAPNGLDGGLAEFADHVDAQVNLLGTEKNPQEQDRVRREAALKLLETLRLSGLTASVPDPSGERGEESRGASAAGAANGEDSPRSDSPRSDGPGSDGPRSKEIVKDNDQIVEVGEACVPETETSADGRSRSTRPNRKPEQAAVDRAHELSQLSSDDWYNLALDLEEADPDKAPQAYRQALAINPQNTDAQVNLGRLCQLQGNLKQARRHYKQALAHAPEHQLANYNMGTIYDELDEFATAREYYGRAKEIPDAHYNLARLFEVQGDELAALRHMKEYRRLLEADISGR